MSVLQWFTLNDVKSGRVHLILEWVPTVSSTVALEQVGLYPWEQLVQPLGLAALLPVESNSRNGREHYSQRHYQA